MAPCKVLAGSVYSLLCGTDWLFIALLSGEHRSPGRSSSDEKLVLRVQLQLIGWLRPRRARGWWLAGPMNELIMVPSRWW